MAKKKTSTKKKRGPGRPKGSGKKKTTKKKRKPGRPKGSKNKPKTGRGPGRPRGSVAKAENVLDLMDGRTTTVTLLKIAYRANELLDAKRKAEVQKVEKAMDQAEKLRKQYEKAMALIGEEPAS